MASPQAAVAKYDRKATAQNWQSGVQGKQEKYLSGIAAFIGVSPTRWGANWTQGIQSAESANGYQEGIKRAGGGQGWLAAYRAAAQRAASG